MAVYQKWLKSMMDAEFASTTIKVMLVDSTYVQDQAHEFRSDITGEITGSGYTAGGATATGVTITLTAGGQTTMTCDPIAFGSLAATDIAGAIFYISTGTSTTDRIIAFDGFGSIPTATTSVYTYNPDPSGVVVATAL